MVKRLRDLRRLWGMYSTAGALGTDLPEAIELLTGAARPILDRWFESDVLKATLATDAIIGAFLSPSSPGSAYVLMHHVMGEAGGARGVWGYVQGGMGGLATALERSCLDLGVEIRREAPVRRILTVGDRSSPRVVGVQLEDGSDLAAPAVASSIDPHWTFERLLSAQDLPEDFARAVSRIDYSSASTKINLALSEPPQFTCLRGTASSGVTPHLNGTIHISPTMDYIERAFDDAKYGRPSRDPVLEMTMPTSVDETIAPPGKHIVGMFVQYTPYQLRAGHEVGHVSNVPKLPDRKDPYPASDSWDEVKESFADRCIEILAQYAPNVPGAILHRQVLSPLDLERTYGITGGNIFQGAMTLGQLFALRPVPGWADHRTPVAGLYLCGAASHPGGGVMGACGRNAAREMLRMW
jgi:phytoene dehydrogenase-like protein